MSEQRAYYVAKHEADFYKVIVLGEIPLEGVIMKAAVLVSGSRMASHDYDT